MKVDIDWRSEEDRYDDPHVHVCIDPEDCWSLDYTLSYILVPALVALKEIKHGSPHVDNEDVPEELRAPEEFDWNTGDVDEFWHERWDWVMEEMIWAFEQIRDGMDGMGYIIENNIDDYTPIGRDHDARIDNGTRLFGKYYRGLWD